MKAATPPPAHPARTLNRPLALLVAGTFFMENLDGTIIATAAPQIAADLQVDPVDVNLAMTVYLITIAVGIPISGWLTDRFGGRRILMIAIAVFTIASALCAASVNLPMLVAMRVLQGAGGALMVPVGRLVVIRVTAKKDMLDAVAYLTWPALLAPVIAPALGGWIVTVASWEWIFLINIPLGIVAFIVAARIVPAGATAGRRSLDWIGFLLCAAALAGLLIGVESIRPTGPSAIEHAVAAVLIVAVFGLTWWWLRRTPEPLLRFDALRQQSFRVSNLGGSVYRLVISAIPFLLPLLFQVGFGWSPARAGFLVLLLFVGNVAIKPATSPLIRRFGFRLVLIGSIAGGVLALIGIALLRSTTSVLLIGAVLILSGVFRSVGFSAYNSLQYADIEQDQMADANTLGSTLQQMAVGLGIALGALLLRIADVAAPSGGPGTAYAVAFVGLAVLMLFPLAGAVLLHRAAGSEISGR
jgi:EmrB/QacA subfamily drug resistance transporter